MSRRCLVLAAFLLVSAGTATAADPPAAARKEPLFRLEAGGPTSVVTSLAFGPDGETLYAAGYDKVVRTWRLQADGTYQLQDLAYRVPIGPGIDGVVNAIALSPDGKWLAVAGNMLNRARADQVRGRRGLVFPVAGLPDDVWEDMGVIYLFDTRTGAVRPLRGHRGPVLGLAFAPALEGQPPVLASAAQEWDAARNGSVGRVRVWDADTGKLRDEWPALAASPHLLRPGLAVGRPRAHPEEVQVAFAWQDGKLRLRSEGKEAWEVDDGEFNGTAAYLPDRDTFLTTSYRAGTERLFPRGNLQEWAVPPAVREHIAFPTKDGGASHLPLALALCSSRPGGPTDLAALVVKVQSPERLVHYVLRLVDLSGRFRTVADVDLGWESADLPVLAAAPGGAYLAVAGNPDDHRVAVYAIAELVKKDARPQALRSQGTTIRYAAFVKKAQASGLLLYEARAEAFGKPPRDPWTGGLVYDFATRTLTAPGQDHGGWKIDEPDTDGWRVRVRAEGDKVKHEVVVLEHRGEPDRTIALRPGYTVEFPALLPPRAPLGVPLVALALRDPDRQRLLALYDGATGEQVRQLSGHTAAVRSLAFSGDGRLLASAAEDQTVCLWTLTDLPNLLGKNGKILGLAVKRDARRQALVVAGVEADSPAAGILRAETPGDAGDAIEGLTPDGGQVQRPASPLAFFEALWQMKPRTNVTLAVRAPGGQARQVVLPVGQGVDERKPLLFLFVTDARAVEQREWLGWNPAGPYDSSSRRTERLLGWQFNPSNPGQPAAAGGAFASADQYRKEYRREGILRDLLVTGNLSDALKQWDREQPPPAPPKMGLWIDEAGPDPRLVAGRVLIRDPNARVMLAINDFPLDRVDEATWQVDDAAPVRFEPGTGLIWSAGVTQPLARGPHTVRVMLRSREAEPKEYTRELLLRYQPPAPEVAPVGAAPQAPVNNPQFRVRAAVKPAPGVKVGKVTLVQRSQGQTVVEKIVGTDVDEPIALKPGDNDIEVVAENDRALRGAEEYERGRLRFTVRLTPPKEKVPPPVIVLAGLGDGARDVGSGTPAVVHVPEVRVRGKITATRPLTSATIDVGDGKPKPLAGFEAGKGKEVEVNEVVRLDPARPLTLRVAARAEDSDEQRAELKVDYRPRPPRIVDLTADAADLHEGKDPRQGRVTGRLELPADGNTVKYTAHLLVNGQEVRDEPVIDAVKKAVTARVPLAARNNSVAVELRTDRGETTLSEPAVLIRYLSPPHDLKLEKPRVGGKAVVDVEGRVESALPLTVLQADVKGEKEADERPLTRLKQEAAGAGAWRVRLQDVPLLPGQNTLRLWASNADGRCLAPATLVVAYLPPPAPPAPPVVEILDPRRDTPVTTADTTVRFHVASAAPLLAVEVLRDNKPALSLPVNPAQGVADPRGLVFAQTVPLLPGTNPLVVRAVNAGGEGSAKVVVSRTEEPVRVVIDAVTPAVPGARPIAPQQLPDGRLRFPPVDVGMVRVSGHVVWDRDDAPAAPGGLPPQVRVYVNGLMQAPADLEPAEPGSKERAFRASVLLNRKGDNYLGVEVPDLKQEGSRRREFAVVCDRPITDQRMHLLIVGVGEQNEDELRGRVLKALRATPEGEDGFRKAGFLEGRVYATLTGSRATPDRVYTQLLVMKRAIERQVKPHPASDIVLIYYQGAEEIRDGSGQPGAKGGHFLLTSLAGQGADLERYSLEARTLREYLDDTLGGEVLLLDVIDVAAAKGQGSRRGDLIAHWTDDDHVGVFRYAWRGDFSRPADSRLLNNLGEAMSEAVTLDQLRGLTEATRKYRDTLFLDYYLPPHLKQFVLNPRPAGTGR